MHPCNGCGALTNNLKYCSRSCSNATNNTTDKSPKRSPEGSCKICSKAIRTALMYCSIECKQIKKDRSAERKRIAASRKVIGWRRDIKKKSVIYLGGKCMKCGYDRCIRALQFHHRSPEDKQFGIAQPTTKSWKRIKLELDKCDLLCANCHAEEEDRIYWSVAQLGTADGRYPSSA